MMERLALADRRMGLVLSEIPGVIGPNRALPPRGILTRSEGDFVVGRSLIISILY